jgi:3-phosphoshikimate 1-carboxyvinyltransferase
MNARLDWNSRPVTAPLQGTVHVPGDKSVSHRAVMLAAIAEGESRIHGFLEGEDTCATARIMHQLGVRIETPEPGERIVHGVGLHGLRGSDTPLDCGNAGTGMRLLAGLLAGQAFDSTLVGDASLSKRPMARVVDPLTAMGAHIDSHDRLPPLHIHGGCRLRGMRHAPEVASAQVKSALLLAGLYAEGETEVVEKHPTRDYTERMLEAFGVPMEYAPGHACVRGLSVLEATDIQVPADFSSAAFFLVAASVVPGSDLTLPSVGLNPRRTGLLEALRSMGADITVGHRREVAGEPIGDLRVRHAPLRGVVLPASVVPDMIDEFPALFVAAALAEGETVVTGAAELRVKESDRLGGMAQVLRTLGAEVEEYPDGARIRGGVLRGGRVDSHGDHRIAMSAAIAGLRAQAPVTITDCANVATSFPGFFERAKGCGFALETGTSRD